MREHQPYGLLDTSSNIPFSFVDRDMMMLYLGLGVGKLNPPDFMPFSDARAPSASPTSLSDIFAR